MMIWVPVPIRENPMMIRRILRCVSMPQSTTRIRRRPVARTMLEIIKRLPSHNQIQGRNLSRITLNSQPTLMPRRTDKTGMAPALKNAPNCPSGSIRLSRKPPARISPAMPANTKNAPTADSVMPSNSRLGWYCGNASRDHGAALEAAACRQVSVHDDIGSKDGDERNENLGASLDDFRGWPDLFRGIFRSPHASRALP